MKTQMETGNNRHLTLGSLFDGAGTIPFAAKLCGIETKWSSEIEKFPLEVTAKRFPNVKQLGDITKINGAEIEPVDIIAGGSPCFPAGTLVLAEKGYVPIETLKVGDLVCTHIGNWKPIEAIGHKEAKTIRVSGGHYGIVCTENHPFYAKKEEYIHTHRNGVKRMLSETKWVEARDMIGHRFGAIKTILPLPIPPMIQTDNSKPPLPITEGLMYIVGRWLGDGWVRDDHRNGRGESSNQHQIFICCNQQKREKLAQRLHAILDGICKIAVFEERTVVKFRFIHKGLCAWLVENFGKYADKKTIPAWIFGLKTSLIEALFCGYIDSDGHIGRDGVIKATTVSKSLAVGMRTVGEILGYQCGLYFSERPKTAVIEGRTVNQKDTYILHFRHTKVKSVIMERDYNWYKCRKIAPTNMAETVYNITVADDHSYIVEGYAVHNCQDLSVAGQRAGLEGKRSGLFMEQIRVIKEMRNESIKRADKHIRPRYAVWENVPGAFSSNKGKDFRIVLEEFCKIKDETAYVPRPADGKWKSCGCIVGDGYSVAWRVLDAQFWGVPQRRRRIWLVADFAGERAPEILFERKGLQRNFAESRKAWENNADYLENGIGTTD